MFGTDGMSAADVAAVTGRNDSDGWGNGNGWWVLIILFALFGGWGNGWGGNRGGGASCATNTGMLTGFNAQQVAMMQGNFGLQQAINDGWNALTSQLANCCCENRQGQADIKYQLASDTCAVTTAISQASRDIADNANANYRALHDELVAMRMEDKNDQIAQLRTEIQQKDLAASQCAQNAYLIQQLRPAAVPAFNVPNPYAGCGYGCYCNQSVA